jgi:hypothetical protein
MLHQRRSCNNRNNHSQQELIIVFREKLITATYFASTLMASGHQEGSSDSFYTHTKGSLGTRIKTTMRPGIPPQAEATSSKAANWDRLGGGDRTPTMLTGLAPFGTGSNEVLGSILAA